MKTFYQYVMTYRGKLTEDDETRLAEWIFSDHNFPKHTYNYDEISRYLECNSPFLNALNVFDNLWAKYERDEKRL